MLKEVFLTTKDIFYPRIIQFSPVRSGSTLVYNLLRETYPKHTVLKRHNITNELCTKHTTVVTYRHPLDCLASFLRKDKAVLSKKRIQRGIEDLKRNGLDDLMTILHHEKILKLKYESFYNDFDLIFNSMETFFGKLISEEHRNKMKKKYHIDNVISSTTKFDDFSQFDKTTFFHGNHISKTKGMPNSFEIFFTEKDLVFAASELKPYLEQLDYKI